MTEAATCAILSLTWAFGVEWFAQELGVTDWLATSLDADGSIGHVWPRDKAQWLERELEARGLSKTQTRGTFRSGAVAPRRSRRPRSCSESALDNQTAKQVRLPQLAASGRLVCEVLGKADDIPIEVFHVEVLGSPGAFLERLGHVGTFG